MNCCEVCGKPLTNPRAKTCSEKCKSIKWRRVQAAKKAAANQPLSKTELDGLRYLGQYVPDAADDLNQLLAKFGKEAFSLAYHALAAYARFREHGTQETGTEEAKQTA